MCEEFQSTVTVSLERAIPVESYGGKASAFISVTLPVGATEDDIQAAIATGKMAWTPLAAALTERIKEQIAAIKSEKNSVPLSGAG